MKQKQKQNIPWDISFCLSPISLCNFQILTNLQKKIHINNTEKVKALYNGTFGFKKSNLRFPVLGKACIVLYSWILVTRVPRFVWY